ncbi:MAG: MFS transporter [Alphaproteobacteria bacterium]|nr:MFS transporter [Alphaproteobacteria bacterium]
MYAQVVIILIGFSGFVGLSIVIPVLPHYAAAYGASALGATAAFAIAAGVAMFSSVLWGRLSDLVGRKPIVIVSLLGQSAAFLWLALAGSLSEVYAARALEGFFVGSIAALIASMSDITTPAQRAGAIGRLSAAFTAGFIVGPVLGGLLATAFTAAPSFFYPFVFTSGVLAVLGVAAVFALPESRTRTSARRLVPMRGVAFSVGCVFTRGPRCRCRCWGRRPWPLPPTAPAPSLRCGRWSGSAGVSPTRPGPSRPWRRWSWGGT